MRPGAQATKLATAAHGASHKHRTGKGARMLARYMISAAVLWTGCSFEGSSTGGGTVAVQGQVVDFQTGAAVVATDVAVTGLIPPPVVDHQGADRKSTRLNSSHEGTSRMPS